MPTPRPRPTTDPLGVVPLGATTTKGLRPALKWLREQGVITDEQSSLIVRVALMDDTDPLVAPCRKPCCVSKAEAPVKTWEQACEWVDRATADTETAWEALQDAVRALKQRGVSRKRLDAHHTASVGYEVASATLMLAEQARYQASQREMGKE